MDLVNKAKSVLLNAAAKAERAVLDLADDFKADLQSIRTADERSGLPWVGKSEHEKKLEPEFKRRILHIAEEPEKYFLREPDDSILLDMRYAMNSANSILEVDDKLRTLRFELVPKRLKEQDFWRRYFIAVNRIKQEVLAQAGDGSLGEHHANPHVPAAPEQQSGLSRAPEDPETEGTREASDEECGEDFVLLHHIPVPPTLVLRKLARATSIARGFRSVDELSSAPFPLNPSSPPSGPDNLPREATEKLTRLMGAGLAALHLMPKDKSEASRMPQQKGVQWSAAEFDALIWSLFDSAEHHEGDRGSSASGTPRRMSLDTSTAGSDHQSQELDSASTSAPASAPAIDASNGSRLDGQLEPSEPLTAAPEDPAATAMLEPAQAEPGSGDLEQPFSTPQKPPPEEDSNKEVLTPTLQLTPPSVSPMPHSASAAPRSENPLALIHDIHGAPPHSFVARVAETMAGLSSEQKMAAFWMKIVGELRKRWSIGDTIPCLPEESQPDLQTCLLHQQLQLINSCLARKKRRAEKLKQLDKETAAAANALASKGTDQQQSESAAKEPQGADVKPLVAGEAEKEHKSMVASTTNGPLLARISNGASVQRLGAEELLPALRMLETGEPIYAPETQEGPLMTEVSLRENEELIMRTGSVGSGCQQLFSDMQAFKAANPGCVLEDFVRWYSPPDWTSMPQTPTSPPLPKMPLPLPSHDEEQQPQQQGPDTVQQGYDSSTGDSVNEPGAMAIGMSEADAEYPPSRGFLSARMTAQGNLWMELWASARPIPAVRQPPLFDEDLSGESTLDTLETIAPSDLFEQLFIAALGAGFSLAMSSPLFSHGRLKRKIMKCNRYIVSTCTRGMSDSKLDKLCQVYQIMETSLTSPFEDEQNVVPRNGAERRGRLEERTKQGRGPAADDSERPETTDSVVVYKDSFL